MGAVQIQHGEIRFGALGDLPAGEIEDLPGPDAQPVQDQLQRDDAGFHQLGVEHRESGLQPHDAVEASRQAPGLFLRAVGGVVRCDAVHGAVQQSRQQGIPVGGYNKLIEALLDGIEVRTGVDYLKERAAYQAMTRKVVYTGSIDEYFDYKLGQLEYRGLHFETERLEEENHQGVAVVNYTEREVPYTRIIEHKHFEFGAQPVTYITREYPADWHRGEEAYYPVNNDRNQKLYQQYAALVEQEENIIFGGRLAEYKYYDMDDVIKSALERAGKEL